MNSKKNDYSSYTLRTSGACGEQLEFDFGPGFERVSSETKIECEDPNKIAKLLGNKPVSLKPAGGPDDI